MIKTNSIQAWFLAARPKTLTAAAVPVLLGIVLALRDTVWYTHHISNLQPVNGLSIQLAPAILCLLFAWVMQIDSNMVNDYFDFKHGNDDETRLGPKRACAEGWITLPAMKWGIIITTLLGCAIGLPLVIYGGWQMVVVGICCVIFCFLYTTTLSYLGLGDILVVAFFGIVPVCCTYYLVLPESIQGVTGEVLVTSFICGMVVDTLLLVNNYRDYENDMRAGKKTLVVHIGKRYTELLYCALGNIAILLIIAITIADAHMGRGNAILLPFAGVYIALHNLTYIKMKRIGFGRELNKVLGMTARNIFIFGIVACLAFLGYVLL